MHLTVQYLDSVCSRFGGPEFPRFGDEYFILRVVIDAAFFIRDVEGA
jgi:hypothetical protein